MSDSRLTAIIAARGPDLLALPGVEGVAESARDGRPVVLVLTSTRAVVGLPAELEGYPIVVEEGGELRARRS